MSLREKLVEAFADYWSRAGYGGLAEERAEDNVGTAMAVVAPLEAIVRDLAASDPADTSDLRCAHCAGVYPLKAEDHEPSCPWRRAVEWTTQEDA